MESDYIFSPNKEKQKTVYTSSNIYYTIIGFQDHIDDNKRPVLHKESDKCFAKVINTEDNKKYYIKIGTYGRLYNPIGMYSEGNSNKFLSRSGKNEYSFKEVDSGIFDMYINFLSTKNLAWLNNAERAMM